MKKVCILLVLLTYVNQRRLHRTALKPDNYLVKFIITSWTTGFDTVQGCDCIIITSRSERRSTHQTGWWIRESICQWVNRQRCEAGHSPIFRAVVLSSHYTISEGEI